MNELTTLLKQNQHKFHCILPEDLQRSLALPLDLSKNSEFANIDVEDTDALMHKAKEVLNQHEAGLLVGKYAENRVIYQGRDRFAKENRCIHLGIDLMASPGTPIFSPLEAIVHSFQDNTDLGDYGPTIILQHQLAGVTFYTLHGHLSRQSLQQITRNQQLSRGEKFAEIGHVHENGRWPPHLHFQLIAEIGDYVGDFPGVCGIEDQEKYLKLCPDPNLILNLRFVD